MSDKNTKNKTPDILQFAITRKKSIENIKKCRQECGQFPECVIHRDFNGCPKTEKEVKDILGRQWKHSLVNIGTFFDFYQYVTHNYETDMPSEQGEESLKLTHFQKETETHNNKNNYDDDDSKFSCNGSLKQEPLCRIFDEHISSNFGRPHIRMMDYLGNTTAPNLAISTHNRRLVDIFGSTSNIARTIKTIVEKLHGLLVVDSSYHFGQNKSHPRIYAYNKACQRLILKMVKKYDIPLLEETRVVTSMPKTTAQHASKDVVDRIKVSSHLHIESPNPTNDECYAILWERYEQLILPRLEKIEKMNISLPREEKIRFRWRISRAATGTITKIGIRATSSVCSLTTGDSSDADDEIYSQIDTTNRNAYLDLAFGTKCWFEYDVHGSIFQVSHLLNFGRWCGNTKDPYPIMFGYELSAEERDAFKSMCMPMYFERTAPELFNHNKMYVKMLLEKNDKAHWTEVVQSAMQNMEKFTGPRLDSEIFLHESLLYTDFVSELRNMDIHVVQVYDGFFLPKGRISDAELENIMSRCANAYYNDYKAWKGI